jgi:membrane-associated PAP2 superfamily phosphatase
MCKDGFMLSTTHFNKTEISRKLLPFYFTTIALILYPVILTDFGRKEKLLGIIFMCQNMWQFRRRWVLKLCVQSIMSNDRYKREIQ